MERFRLSNARKRPGEAGKTKRSNAKQAMRCWHLCLSHLLHLLPLQSNDIDGLLTWRDEIHESRSKDLSQIAKAEIRNDPVETYKKCLHQHDTQPCKRSASIATRAPRLNTCRPSTTSCNSQLSAAFGKLFGVATPWLLRPSQCRMQDVL